MAILGIDLGGTNVRVGSIDKNSLVRVESMSITKDGSANEVINEIFILIEKFSISEIKLVNCKSLFPTETF